MTTVLRQNRLTRSIRRAQRHCGVVMFAFALAMATGLVAGAPEQDRSTEPDSASMIRDDDKPDVIK